MSNIDTTDYTFSNIDWSALPVEALAGFGQTATSQPAAPTITMTPQEAEAAAAMALGQPTGRPPVDAALPETAEPAPTPTDGSGVVKVPTSVGAVTQPRKLEQSARDLIKEQLKYYGLDDPELLNQTYAFYEQPEYDTLTESQYSALLMKAVKRSTAYQTRFGFLDGVNKTRQEKGQPVLTEGEVVGMEEAYRNVFKFYDMPTELYDQTTDFQKLIEGNVDAPELQDRIRGGYDAVRNSSPDVINQMKTLYGVDEAKLAAYFIDPTKMKTTLIRQAEAAKTAGAAAQGGVQLDVTMAERLAAENISPERVRQGAATVSQQAQVQQALQAGEDTISQAEALQAEFGLSEAAAQRIRQRQRRRISEFEQGGGFAQTQAGVTGLRTVGQ